MKRGLRTVLFVCVENRFRSQIAEAYFRKYAPEGWEATSAGIKPAEKVHPKAVELMLEEGIDLSQKKPQLLTRELQKKAEIVVVVCGEGTCPVVRGKLVEKWNLPDPAKMPLEEARKIRDIIKKRVLDLVGRLGGSRGENGKPQEW